MRDSALSLGVMLLCLAVRPTRPDNPWILAGLRPLSPSCSLLVISCLLPTRPFTTHTCRVCAWISIRLRQGNHTAQSHFYVCSSYRGKLLAVP